MSAGLTSVGDPVAEAGDLTPSAGESDLKLAMLLFRGGKGCGAVTGGPGGPATCGIGAVCVRGGVWM